MSRSWSHWIRTIFVPRPSRGSRLTALRLEDRITPVVSATFNAGTLAVTLDAAGDHAFLRVDATNQIDVAGDAGFSTLVVGSPFAGVTKISVGDTAASGTAQAVDFVGAIPFNVNAGLNTVGIETVDVFQAITAATGSIDIQGADSLVVNAVATVPGGATLRAGSVSFLANGLLDTTGAADATISANNLAFDSAAKLTVGTKTVTIDTLTPATVINLGAGDTAGVLGLDAGELNRIFAKTLSIGTAANTGGVLVSTAVSPANISDLGLTTAGSVAVSAALTVPGALNVTTVDQAGSGQNISVSAPVIATAGAANFQAGDDFILTVTGSIQAGTTVAIAVDANVADAGTGATATLRGTFSTGSSVALTGGGDADTFNITAQTGPDIQLNGGAGANALNFDANNKVVNQTATAVRTFGGNVVSFTNIETVTVLNPGGTLILGTNLADAVILRRNAGVNEIQVNGGGFAPLVGPAFAFSGNGGDDTLTVDLSGGPLGLTSLNFDGGIGSDLLRVLGNAGSTVGNYTPSATTPGSGRVTMDGQAIDFLNLQPVDIDGAASFSITPPGDADALTVLESKLFGDATKDAIRVTGTSGGVAIEGIALRNVTAITIDTQALVEDAAKADAVTVGAIDALPLVAGISIVTAPAVLIGTDTVTLTGAIILAGAMSIQTNTIIDGAGTIQTGGAQFYAANAMNITSASTFNSTGGASLTFATPINGAFSATFNTTGTTALESATVASVLTNVGGTTTVGGIITTTGAQTYNDAVLVTAATTFAAGGAITFASTLDGGFAVVVNTTGLTTFANAVGGLAKLASLSTNAGGTTKISGGSVTTTAGQTYGDAVLATGTTMFTAGSGGTIAFNSTLDAAADVVVTASVTIYAGAVNVPGQLLSLGTGAIADQTRVGADITAGTAIFFATDVLLTGPATFTSTGGAAITFSRTLDGGFAATAKTSNLTAFGSTVGGSIPLASLTTDATGRTNFNGSVTTTGAQIFNDAATVSNDASFTSTAGGAIRFAGTIDGGFKVIVNTTDATVFAKAVGSLVPLASLTTNASGNTTFAGGTVTTASAQIYQDAVLATGSTMFFSTGNAAIAFASTLTATANIAVNTGGTTTFGAAVSVGGNLTTDMAGGAAEQTVIAGNITVAGTITFNDAVMIAPTNVAFTSTGGGTITFVKTLDGGFTVTVNTAGTTTFGGLVGSIAPMLFLVTAGTGPETFVGGVTTIGDQFYPNPVTASGTFQTPGNSNISFGSTLGGTSVAVNTTGFTTFHAVNLTGSLMTNGAGVATERTSFLGGTVTTGGSQTYNDNSEALGNTTFTSTGVGAITFSRTLTGNAEIRINTAGPTTFGGTVTVGTDLTTDAAGSTIAFASVTAAGLLTFSDPVTVGGNLAFASIGGKAVTFNSTLDGRFDVAVNTAGLTTFAKAVGSFTPLASLTTDAAGTTDANGSKITTNGAQTYRDDVVLSADAIFTSTAQAIRFEKSLTGAFATTVNTPDATVFGGAVSTKSLSTDSTGNTQVNGGSITTTAFQAYGDAVIVGSDTAFAASTIAFQSTLTGAGNVAVNSSGTTRFGGDVNLGSLTTDAAGDSLIVSRSITTSGSQTYNDVLTIFGDTTLTSNAGGAIRFAKELDATGPAIVINTGGATTFDGPVVATRLTTDAPGTTTIKGGAFNVQEFATFNDAVSVASNDLQFVGGTVTFASTLSGSKALDATAQKSVAFLGAVTLARLQTSGPGTTDINGGSITTTGDQIYGEAVVLSADTTLVSTAGSIRFDGTLDATTANGQALALRTPIGNIDINRPAGASTALGNVTIADAANVTLAASASLLTSALTQQSGSGTTTFNGDVTATSTSTFALKTAAIRFAATIRSSGPVSLTTTAGGVSQPSGTLIGPSLGLFGVGPFDLNQSTNDIATTLAANITAGSITVADANSLTVDFASGGIITNNGEVTIRTNRDFTVADTRDAASRYTTPVVNLGAGSLVVLPGLTGRAKVTFDAEATAKLVSLGIANGGNNFGDTFSVRPSATTPISVFGNDPTPSGSPPFDSLLPNFANTKVTFFTTNGQDGSYTFNTRQKLSFFGIESLTNLAFAGFAVQTAEPGDSTNPAQPQYVVRILRTQDGVLLGGGLNGNGLPQNAFVVSPKLISPNNPYGSPRIAFGDVNGDTVADLIIANGPGAGPLVTVINGNALNRNADQSFNSLETLPANQIIASFFAYSPDFVGGVNVAVGDIDDAIKDVDGAVDATGKKRADAKAVEIVTGADIGGGPHVRTFTFVNGQIQVLGTALGSFFPYGPDLRGGVHVAVGDVDGDGHADIITGAGVGGGPRVQVESGASTASNRIVLKDFFAYEDSFRGGVFVDAGNYTGDTAADILTAPGLGGGARIKVFDGRTNGVAADFFAFQASDFADPLVGGSSYRGGVGGVAFGAGNEFGSRNILVSTPRGPGDRIFQFTGNGGTPAASSKTDLLALSVFTAPKDDKGQANPVINPSTTKLNYGGTVGGFLQS